jgi:hypothetical protein
MIPQNLLGQALSIIGKQSFLYVRFLTRSENAIGLDVSQYAAPVPMVGSVQAIPRNLYERYGLDLQGDYKTFYVSSNIIDVERIKAGDQFIYANQRYQSLSETDWFLMNGWTGIVCVHVPGDCTVC